MGVADAWSSPLSNQTVVLLDRTRTCEEKDEIFLNLDKAKIYEKQIATELLPAVIIINEKTEKSGVNKQNKIPFGL